MVPTIKTHYFDVLPVHPQPKPLESLTSYLTRIAQTNHLKSVDALSGLLFPNQSRRTTRTYTDFPPAHLDDLVKSTVCPAPRLLETTFSHLGAKFGRSIKPQPLSRFLRGAIADKFHFCPKCLDEYGHYSLTWRFQSLPGCIEHGCKLIDKCTECGNSIPFLAAPLEIGICPSCGHDLSQLPAFQLSSSELQKASKLVDDLRFLLTPHPNEAEAERTITELGLRLASMRFEQGLSITEICSAIDVSPNMIEGIEHGKIALRGASFLGYKRYADAMGVSLKELFLDTSQPKLKTIDNKVLLMAKVNQALEMLQSTRKTITQRAVAETAGVSTGALYWYPEIIEYIRQAQIEQTICVEKELVHQVQEAVKIRCWERKQISQQKIATDIGVNRATLRKSQQALTIIRQAKRKRP
jgi:transcriptional regulator with XRE-family HTH domain